MAKEMSETPIVKAIQVAASKHGARLFRNNVGALETKNGQWVTYGLCVGSSDLIGWTPVKVTADMLGHTVAVFTAVEVKAPQGRVSEEQANFVGAVTLAGGYAFVARSEDDLIRNLRRNNKKI